MWNTFISNMENYEEITIIGSPRMWESEWEHNKFTYTITYLNKVRISAPVTWWSQRSQIVRRKRLKGKGFSQSAAHCYRTTCRCYISKTSFLTAEIRLPLRLLNILENTAHNTSHCFSSALRDISPHLKTKKPSKWKKMKEVPKIQTLQICSGEFGRVLHTRNSFLRELQLKFDRV